MLSPIGEMIGEMTEVREYKPLQNKTEYQYFS